MNPTQSAELARHAWDFRDAAVGAEHLLGERTEYLNAASVPVACLFGTSIELALRAYILAMNPASTQALSKESAHDLEALYDEASELGLTRLVGIDGYDVKLFGLLRAVCSKRPAQYLNVGEYDIHPYSGMKRLCEKLLEIAGATAGYERVTY